VHKVLFLHKKTETGKQVVYL